VVLLAAVVATLAVLRPRPPAPREPDKPAFVMGDGAPLKKAPAQTAETVGRLPGGAKVRLVADLGRWYEVRTEKGESGFVSADSVEKESDREARERQAKIIAAFPPVFGLVAEDTDILLAPFPQAPHNGRLARGAVISIHAVDHSFYAFQTASKQIAYVNSADVDLVPVDPGKPEIKPAPGKAIKDLSVLDSGPPAAEVEPEGDAEPVRPQGVPGPLLAPPREASAPPPVLPAAADAVEAAVLVTRVEPPYPERARRAGVEGTVVLEVAISAKGDVTEVEVVRGLPLGVSEAAADAVRRWKYRPAHGKDGPVASRRTVRILFTLGH
jgi:periplasmic protein TonB